MMQRVFIGKISDSDELIIKYLDDDGDKITLSTDSDLSVALQFHQQLRLYLYVNSSKQIKRNATENVIHGQTFIDISTFQCQLRQIRNSMENMLDRLSCSSSTNTSTTKDEQEHVLKESVPLPAVAAIATSEFDPYSSSVQRQCSNMSDGIPLKLFNSNVSIDDERKPLLKHASRLTSKYLRCFKY
jgi:hypothetical protein